LGEVLDPAADRLYIAATIVALGVRAIIPWWLIAVLALRELTVGVALAVLRRRAGFGSLQVSFVGKAATLCLLYAFPLLFLADHREPAQAAAARGQPPDHGARAAAAQAARIRRDRGDRPVPRRPRPELLWRRRGVRHEPAVRHRGDAVGHRGQRAERGGRPAG